MKRNTINLCVVETSVSAKRKSCTSGKEIEQLRMVSHTSTIRWVRCLAVLISILLTANLCQAKLVKLHLYNDLDPASKITQLHSTWPKYPSDLQDKASEVGKAVFDLSFAQDHIKLLTMDPGSPDFVVFSLPEPVVLGRTEAIYLLLSSFNTFDCGLAVGEIELVFADGDSSTLTSDTFSNLKLKVGETIGDIWGAAVLGFPRCTNITSPASRVWTDGSNFLNMLKLDISNKDRYNPTSAWDIYKVKQLTQIRVKAKELPKDFPGGVHAYGGIRLMGVTVDGSWTLGDEAARLARHVIGGAYLSGGKGWAHNVHRYLEPSEIKTIEYKYWNSSITVNDWDLGKGLDCSGLVFWAYNKADGATTYVSIVPPDDHPDTSEANPVYYVRADWQYRWNTAHFLDKDMLDPGDLLFIENNSAQAGLDHVMLYTGDFEYADRIYNFVSASTPGIKPSKILNPTSESGFVSFGRVIGPQVDETIFVCSPVELVVTDPDGLTISRDIGEIPGGMCYDIFDHDMDGEDDAVVTVPERKIGDYHITVTPKTEALPTDTYTLKFASENTTLTLAKDVPIAAIPAGSYIVRISESGIPVDVTPLAEVPFSIDIDPDTLNPASVGKWITCYIHPPEGYAAGDIDVGTVLMEGILEVQKSDIQDGVLMVKFDRQAVTEMLEPGVQTIEVTGQLYDGTLFAGTDTIQVIGSMDDEMAGQEVGMPLSELADAFLAMDILDEDPKITNDDEGDMGDNEWILVDEAAYSLFEAGEIINELGPESFNNEVSAIELSNGIEAIFAMLDEGLYIEALAVLEGDVLERMDGCANIGEPDEDDWVTSIEGQVLLYPLLTETIKLLESLI